MAFETELDYLRFKGKFLTVVFALACIGCLVYSILWQETRRELIRTRRNLATARTFVDFARFPEADRLIDPYKD